MRPLLVILILTIYHETNACMFKKRDGPDPENYWDAMTFERKEHSSKCGTKICFKKSENYFVLNLSN